DWSSDVCSSDLVPRATHLGSSWEQFGRGWWRTGERPSDGLLPLDQAARLLPSARSAEGRDCTVAAAATQPGARGPFETIRRHSMGQGRSVVRAAEAGPTE